jgi:hypothetical protein
MRKNKLLFINATLHGALLVFIILGLTTLPVVLALIGIGANFFYLYLNYQSVSSCSINKVDTPDQILDGQSVLDDLDRELDRRREADQLNRN